MARRGVLLPAAATGEGSASRLRRRLLPVGPSCKTRVILKTQVEVAALGAGGWPAGSQAVSRSAPDNDGLVDHRLVSALCSTEHMRARRLNRRSSGGKPEPAPPRDGAAGVVQGGEGSRAVWQLPVNHGHRVASAMRCTTASPTVSTRVCSRTSTRQGPVNLPIPGKNKLRAYSDIGVRVAASTARPPASW
jgi:hypothetical protein